jgi:hypothetical protein
LVVDQIVDIVEQPIALRHGSERDRVVGSLVVQGAVTDLLDIQQVIAAVAGFDVDQEARYG